MKELLYEYISKWRPFGEAVIARLIARPGTRQYSAEIMERDRRIDLEIEQSHKCPHCGKTIRVVNSLAYPMELLFAEVEAVFSVWVLASKRKGYADKFRAVLDKIEKAGK